MAYVGIYLDKAMSNPTAVKRLEKNIPEVTRMPLLRTEIGLF